MVGWDGIEPPGPGFSVPPTAWRMPGKYQTYRASFLRADLLERAPKGLNPPPMVTNWWQSGSVNSIAPREAGSDSRPTDLSGMTTTQVPLRPKLVW